MTLELPITLTHDAFVDMKDFIVLLVLGLRSIGITVYDAPETPKNIRNFLLNGSSARLIINHETVTIDLTSQNELRIETAQGRVRLRISTGLDHSSSEQCLKVHRGSLLSDWIVGETKMVNLTII